MERIGDYTLEQVVSEDWLWRVHDATDASGTPVVLREIRPEHVDSPNARATLLPHAQALVAVRHPSLVTHHAVDEIDGRVVLVTERVQGESLTAYLQQRGRLPSASAVAIGTAIARGLAAAHNAPTPIVHRDLKPDNVRIDGEGQVKIVDFDLSWALERLARTTSAGFRNMRYMSPEQIDAVGIDGRTDLYCLGLLLYEMLVGKPPFTATSPRELLMAQCTRPPPRFPDALRAELPSGLEQLVFRLLEKNKLSRPQSAAEVITLLDGIARGQPPASLFAASGAVPAASGGPAPSPAAKPSGGTAGLVIAVVMVAVVVLGGGGFAAWNMMASDEEARPELARATATSSGVKSGSGEPQGDPSASDGSRTTSVVPQDSGAGEGLDQKAAVVVNPPPPEPEPVVPEPVVPEPVVPEPVVPEPVVPEPVQVEEEPAVEELTRGQRINRWVGSSLKGHDNGVAAIRDVTITKKGGGFEIFVKNQFAFTCDLDFDEAGFPSKMRNCKSGDPGWGAKQKSIKLACEVVKKNEQCRGRYTLTKGDFEDPAAFKFFRRLREDELPPESG